MDHNILKHFSTYWIWDSTQVLCKLMEFEQKTDQDKSKPLYQQMNTELKSPQRMVEKTPICLWGTPRSGKNPELNNVQVEKSWILLSLSSMVKSKHNSHLQMCKICVWLHCRIGWVLDDELHSSLMYAYESEAGTTVHRRNNTRSSSSSDGLNPAHSFTDTRRLILQ